MSDDQIADTVAGECLWGPGCLCHQGIGPAPDLGPRYGIVIYGDQYLVVDLPRKGVARFGMVLAVCHGEGPAKKIRAALEAKYPGDPDLKWYGDAEQIDGNAGA